MTPPAEERCRAPRTRSRPGALGVQPSDRLKCWYSISTSASSSGRSRRHEEPEGCLRWSKRDRASPENSW